MRVTIEVTAGPARGRLFNIDHADLFIVGRARDSRISLPNDPYLSRQHFVIEVSPPNCKITDLGSKNGTFVNGVRYGGRKVETATVKQAPDGELSVVIDSGEIVVGDTRLKVRCGKRTTPVPGSTPSGSRTATLVKGAPAIDSPALETASGSPPIDEAATNSNITAKTGLDLASLDAAAQTTPKTIHVQKAPVDTAVPARRVTSAFRAKSLPRALPSLETPNAHVTQPVSDDQTIMESPPGEDSQTTRHDSDEAPSNFGGGNLQCAFCGKECSGEVRTTARIPGAEYVCHECRANRAFAQRERQPRTGKPPLDKQSARLSAELNAGEAGAAHANLVFPGYKVIDVIGSGGMGVVYRAVRQSDDRVVAIKSLLPNVPVSFENYRIFHREIELSSQLKHPNIVEVLDHGRVKGAYFCVMEFVDGLSLKDFLHQMGGRLTLKQAAPLMMDILAGLSAAHHAQIETRTTGTHMVSGIVHRDLKPENILLQRTSFGWTPKIADFGIAKNFETAGMTDMTIAGVCGTPTYWPREQLTHYRYLHPATDVFSVAAVFFEMLSGRCARPGMQETLVQFQRRSQSPALADFMRVIGTNPIPSVRVAIPSLPQPVAAVLDKALQEIEVPLDEVEMRDTLQRLRYPDAGVFREELARALKYANVEI